MPKLNPNEPWLHQASGYWCKKVSGKVHYLDKDYRVAKRQLAALWREERKRASGAFFDGTFVELCDEYLEDIKARKSSETYRGYKYRLLRALKNLPSNLRVCEFRRFHMTKVEQALTDNVSSTSIRDTLATIQFVFNWAVKNDLLEINPVVGYEKPRARARSRIISPEEFQALLRALSFNRPFQRVLIALRRTGCRPKEVRTLTWEMVDLGAGFWIIPEHKTITTQRQPRPRFIPLPDCVWKMCLRLKQQQDDSEFVFLNSHQQPYSKDRFVRLMARARKRADIPKKAGETLVLYSNRHTFGTEATGKVTDIELAELMGHTDTKTTRRYVHLNSDRLRDIQRRLGS